MQRNTQILGILKDCSERLAPIIALRNDVREVHKVGIDYMFA